MQGGEQLGMAQAERDGGAAEPPRRKGEGERVGGERARSLGLPRELVPCQGEHRDAEVGCRDPRAAVVQSDRLVAGAAAEIQHLGPRRHVQSGSGAAAPDDVQVGRQQMVEQIVARRHSGEHVLDGAPRFVEAGSSVGHAHSVSRSALTPALSRLPPPFPERGEKSNNASNALPEGHLVTFDGCDG